MQVARERARKYLRARQPFVWNANTQASTRERLVSLCESYHASVRIVYLETSWSEQLERNDGRTATVPRRVIDRMLAKLEPPMPAEARKVEWHCV